MPALSDEENGWVIPCSDEESGDVKPQAPWKPSPADVLELYETLENGPLELEWQCPGRRPPPIAADEFDEESEEAHESKPEEKSDFDFMDDTSKPILRNPISSRGGPKGSAKKKTTSLSGILSNMLRHRQQEQQEREEVSLESKRKT